MDLSILTSLCLGLLTWDLLQRTGCLGYFLGLVLVALVIWAISSERLRYFYSKLKNIYLHLKNIYLKLRGIYSTLSTVGSDSISSGSVGSGYAGSGHAVLGSIGSGSMGSGSSGPGNVILRPLNFQFYHHATGNVPTEISVFNVDSCRFDPDHQLRVLVHGHGSNPFTADVCRRGGAALLNLRNCSVILVDWSLDAKAGIWPAAYLAAKNRGKKVGLRLAQLIDEIIDVWHIPLRNIGFVAHSLGVCVIDSAGKNLKDGRKVGFALALDPSRSLSMRSLIDTDAAKYVQVIHTDDNLGDWWCQGHADFYPHNGHDQPGCSSALESHQRAVDLWIESIHPSHTPFWAIPSKIISKRKLETDNQGGRRQQAFMGGEPIDRFALGPYYLFTKSRSPFSWG